MSMSLIVFAIVAVIILVIGLYFIIKISGNADSTISCEGDNKKCSPSSNCGSVDMPGAIPQPDRDCAKKLKVDFAYCCVKLGN